MFYLVKKFGFFLLLNEKYFSLKVSERPSLLKKISSNKRHYFYNRFPDEIIILIVCVIAILLFAFVFFLIYHFRNEKSLRQTLLATRILATRSINNLKNVSSNYFIEFSNIFYYEQNQLYRSDIDPKTKRSLIEENCRRFPTEGTISTIISSYYDNQCEFSRAK